MDPSCSVRVTRRLPCSQVTSRPWPSSVLPLEKPDGLPEQTDVPGHLVPAQHAVVGDVAPHDVPAGGDVDRPLRPSASVVQALDPRVAAALREPLVDDLERGWNRLWLGGSRRCGMLSARHVGCSYSVAQRGLMSD